MKLQIKLSHARTVLILLLAVLSYYGAWAEELGGYNFDTEGEGADKVYLIKTETDLENLAAYVNAGNNCSGLTFKLNTDITMTGAHTPIGGRVNNMPRYFRGTFDGNKMTITNLTINQPEANNQGLFGSIWSAVVKDLTLVDCHITAKSCVGGIAGIAYGDENAHSTIENCHVVNGGIASTETGADSHGGIIGNAYQYTDISLCSVSGTISTKENNSEYGGIVGYMRNSSVTACENTANITGSGQYHGGITGITSQTNSVSLCFNTGTIEGSSSVGAIIGNHSSQSSCSDCYYASPCNVKGIGSDYGPESGSDVAGQAERVYTITASGHVADIAITEDATVTSKSGQKYYKAGNWTATLTLEGNYNFINYVCEGGVLADVDVAAGGHTLTISNADVAVSALASISTATDIAGATITPIGDKRWKGYVGVTPALYVTYNSTPLVEGTDYVVTYTNNTTIGNATATLTGINNYAGTKAATFNIVDLQLQDPTAANSADNPYLISTEEDLEALAGIVNSGARTGGYYKQTITIDCYSEHTAIGTANNYFCGNYDGDNKPIRYLTINKPGEGDQGLFGYIKNAAIQKVVLVGCNITGGFHTGGIAGYMLCDGKKIEKCTVNGVISSTGNSGDAHGGIVGYLYKGTIDQCVNTAIVTGNGSLIGGIAGHSEGYLTNNFNAGTVEGVGNVGSIVGRKMGGTLTNNYHTAATTGGVGEYHVATGTDQEGAETAVAIALRNGVTMVSEPVGEVYGKKYYDPTVTLNWSLPVDAEFVNYTVNSGEISNPTVMTGEHTLTGFTGDVVISAVCNMPAVTYLDMNGEEQTVTDYALLTGSESNLLDAGWYVVDGTLNYSHGFSFKGDVHFILKDGAKLNIGTEQSPISSYGLGNAGQYFFSIDVYGQSTGNNNGQLNVYTTSYPVWAYYGNFNCSSARLTLKTPYSTPALWALGLSGNGNGNITLKDATVTVTTQAVAIYANGGNVTINGGEVTATGNGYAIQATNSSANTGNVTINGGKVSATAIGNHGICCSTNGTITLGWTSADDRITASSYYGNVVIANGQAFVNGSDIYAGTLSAAEKSAIAGLTLQPYAQETIVMNANGIRTYASPYNLDFTDIEGLTAYMVTAVNNNTLTLTQVNKAPAGTGLLLKGTADANFNVPTTASAAAIADNYLVGVLSGETVVQKTETVESIDYTNFILANGSYGIDWYTLSQNGAIGANKAYLRLPTDALSNGARLTMEFGDATGVGEMRNEKGGMRNGAWYTVNGVRLSGKPTRKGLYIFNGKITVVK